MTLTPLRRRGTTLAAAIVSAALVLTACGGSPEETPAGKQGAASQTRSFKADNGTVEIPTDPKRVVALGSPETYLALGVEPVGLGERATKRNLAWLPPEAAKVNESVVEVGDEVDYEKVAGLKPDLIVVYEPEHVLTGDSYNEKRLQSIAPTVFIELSNERWKTQVKRLAEVVNAVDTFEAGKAEYDALISDIKEEHAEVLKSTTFMALQRWGGNFSQQAGTLSLEYPGSYCTSYAEDAGLDIVPEAPANGDLAKELSMEKLGDTVADADVLLYPLEADGKVKPEFEPVLESNIWKSLPQVKEGRALGVQCNQTSTYASKVPNVKSLKEKLGRLSEAG
ncbi:ABC transporter substrate-binding protein [Streptomyces boninensis]|uniref:ABC transporter substrate-binding protein n=1 Tax=Streptomyces boninensis TaxID=2039455 RepID=UPI003B21A698